MMNFVRVSILALAFYVNSLGFALAATPQTFTYTCLSLSNSLAARVVQFSVDADNP